MTTAGLQTWGQSNLSLSENRNINQNSTEKVFVHTNATTFVVGETIFYKIYCLNSANFNPSKISRIAYLELIDVEKKTVFKHKLFLNSSSATGYFFVPTTIKTGTYKLIGYTNWMLNATSPELFQENITLINPYIPIEKNDFLASTKEIRIEKNLISNHEIPTSDVFVELNKTSFVNRDFVSFKIKSSNKDLDKGNYSLSVRKLDELSSTKITSIEFENKKADLLNPNLSIRNSILPELRGENISGSITSKSNSDVQNIIIAFCIPGKDFLAKTVKTNSQGKFIFTIDKPYYQSNVLIQVFDENRQDFTINLDKPLTIDYKNINLKSRISFNPELKEIIEQKSIANQIENAYFSRKKDSVFSPEIQMYFYEPISKDYILDDYTRFPTTKETVTEVLKEMYYTQKNNTYTIGLRDYNSNIEAAQPALVMIDGLIIQDLTELFDYKMSNVYKVSIVAGGYYYGSSVFNGLINFVTKEKNFESKLTGDFIIKPELLRPIPNKIYSKIDYSDKQKLERIPDVRYQLLWEPNFDIQSPIAFYTSDISGKFEISIEGFTDTGNAVSVKEYFEVK